MNLQEATKRITLEYIKTGYECYQTLINYINGDMKGNLDLGNTKVSSLPKDLKVGGNLFLKNTLITSLPEGLNVGYDLYLRYTPISKMYTVKQLKQMLPNVKGEIYI